MAQVALLSNPMSTGNRAYLPRIRAFCALRSDVFHYEVDEVGQINEALQSIARVKPRLLVINGGDGTVQAALTALHNGRAFGDTPPPVAVLPNGKTNLIAHDLGSHGDPVAALERALELAAQDFNSYLVRRELIALSADGQQPVLGMFLGGAGLADAMLYCRHRIYPLGLPNGVSHFLATVASLISVAIGLKAWFLPAAPNPVRLRVRGGSGREGRYAILIVTTLEKMLLGTRAETKVRGLKLMLVERSLGAIIRAFMTGILGRGRPEAARRGVHLEQNDEIEIESDESAVLLDGELFSARRGRPITLRSTAPMPFLRLAA